VRLWRRLGAHLEACRPDSVFYIGLVGVAGCLLATRHPSGWRLLGAWSAPTFGWLASLYGGDYFDRRLDAIAKPHRPIPSGRMAAREAFGGMVVSIAAGLTIAVALNPLNLVVVIGAGILGVSYSAVFKARGILGNLVRGGPTALAFILGTMATGQRPPLVLVPVAVIFWLHDSGSNLVGALCDVDGDRRGGYQTFPIRHGDSAALHAVSLFYLLWLALAAAYPGAVLIRFDPLSYAPFLIVADLLGLIVIIKLIRAPHPVPRLHAVRAHEILVVERLVLAGSFVAAASSARYALALLIPSSAVTLIARSLMRTRYEPRCADVRIAFAPQVLSASRRKK